MPYQVRLCVRLAAFALHLSVPVTCLDLQKTGRHFGVTSAETTYIYVVLYIYMPYLYVDLGFLCEMERLSDDSNCFSVGLTIQMLPSAIGNRLDTHGHNCFN